MKPWNLLKRLWQEDRAATAALVALLITSLVGFTALAVDLGMLLTAKAQVQNAADSAALAAVDTMLAMDAQQNTIAQPTVALESAETFSSANQAMGVSLNLKDPPGDDFIIGYWDPEAGDFDYNRTGLGISNPDDLTGVRVTVRRDEQANTPVSTIFAKIMGVSEVAVKATSTAFLGYPGKVPKGAMLMPIAVSRSLATNGDGPNCGEELSIGQTSGSYWTSFFTWPASNPNVDDYACGCLKSPEVKVGDSINITNGNLSNNTFGDLQDLFNAHETGGQWNVILPVIEDGYSHGSAPVVGFAAFTVTEVNKAPQKNVIGVLACGIMVPNSTTGGQNFGARASTGKMAR